MRALDPDLDSKSVKLILEFLPVRCYLLAARVGSESVNVWEISVDSRGGGRERARADLLHVLKPSVVSRAHHGHNDGLRFLPSSDILVGNFRFTSTKRGDANVRGAVFWDARSGSELMRIDEMEIIGSSLSGDTVLGRGRDTEGLKLTLSDAASGRALRTVRPGRELTSPREIVEAAFSPEGDLVAVLVSQNFTHDVHWNVEIWNSSTGALLCGSDVLHSEHKYGGFWDFAFNGSVIAICRGWLGVTLAVERYTEGCAVIQQKAPERCDATHLPTGAQLQISPAFARIIDIGAKGPQALHFASLDMMLDAFWEGLSHGVFSPDGRSVAVTRMQETHIWPFGRGGPPRIMCMQRGWYPVFSADSAIVAVVCAGQEALQLDREILVFNSDGDQLLRLTAGNTMRLGNIAINGPSS